MSWSLGEIEALATKAARGAGYSWAEANEAGWAVRWLCRSGLSGTDALAALISTSEDGLCPIDAGLTISDAGGDWWPEPGVYVQVPLLILPFVGRISGAGVGLAIRVGETVAMVCADGALSDVSSKAAQISLVGAVPRPVVPRRARVAELSADVRDTLQNAAARTYAPATERSRQLGAGAGLADND